MDMSLRRLLLIFAFVACHREEPRLPSPPLPPPQKSVSSPYAGCYSINPPLELTKLERVEELRLTETPVRAVFASELMTCPDHCSWEEKDGKVVIGVGTGFVGWGLTLSPTERGLEGVAEFGADVPVDPNPTKVLLVRKPCG
jgi:hypothetical protein